MLAGLEHVDEGAILIDGKDVVTLPPRDRDIAMVFQNYALYPHMNVAQNMGFALRMAGVAKGRDRAARAGRGEDPRHRGVPRAEAPPALRRATPAGRDGPRDRPRAERLPDGRAALEPRCEASGRHESRDLRAAAQPRGHDRLRHARPGRGDDHGAPRRRDEGRSAPAVRYASPALRGARERVRGRVHRLAANEPSRCNRRGRRRQDRSGRSSRLATVCRPSSARP